MGGMEGEGRERIEEWAGGWRNGRERGGGIEGTVD